MRTFVFILFLTISISAISQQNLEFDIVNFPGQEKALNKAIRQIEEGDSYYMAEDYVKHVAIDYYLPANTFNPNNSLLNFKLGICYWNSKNKFKSLEFFQKAYLLNPSIDSTILYYLGLSNQINLNFDDAIKYYTLYDKVINKKKEFDPETRINECITGARLREKPVRAVIQNIGSVVNSEYPDFAPLISADESVMYFTSRRKNNTNKEIADDGKFYEDIFFTSKKDNKWIAPKRLPYPVNSYLHDAALALSPDGQRMLLYSGENKGDILETRLIGDKWSKPIPAAGGKINSAFRESHACYSYDGRAIYFVSDNPENNIGGLDIFIIRQGIDSTWGKPENLGAIINTPSDEDGVFMQADGKTMYFNSNGHETIGQSDIFKSIYENDTWSKPINLGYPINTPEKDAFFVISASGKTGYYSSARVDALGETDIYRITMLGPEKSTILVSEDQDLTSSASGIGDMVPRPPLNAVTQEGPLNLKGFVVDSATGYPLSAFILVTDDQDKEILNSVWSSSLTGDFLSEISRRKNFNLSVIAEGYEMFNSKIELPETKNPIERSILMKKLKNEGTDKDLVQQAGQCVLRGTISDHSTGKILGAIIILRDIQTNEIIGLYPNKSSDGTFNIKLNIPGQYSFTILSDGYANVSEKVEILKAKGLKEVVKEVKLTKLSSEPKSEKVQEIKPGPDYLSEVTIFKGKTLDASSKNVINATIIVTDIEKNEVVSITESNSKSGEFLIPLPSGRNYGLTISKPNYLFYSENINLPKGQPYQELIKNIELNKIQVGEKILLNNIFYEIESAKLKDESKTELDRLVELLKSNPIIRIEISSHTDNVGSAAKNDKLSFERAIAVVNYLVSKGIEKTRLEYKGLGFSKPVAPNDTEEGRRMNRRTEFRIISN